ncbi:unnamed protein product [Tuber melanosporum]|uniref:(Perigord truffle) hypothetical protein n=1 Tax=Tuber melanosporum (strain Mel28) TaxID=656061 RepID=D5GP20_TUBMM|nr:unnamed protein product [Tuber melanosporum]
MACRFIRRNGDTKADTDPGCLTHR